MNLREKFKKFLRLSSGGQNKESALLADSGVESSSDFPSIMLYQEKEVPENEQ